jgi:hypothetical protein
MSRVICYNPPPVGYITEYHAISYDFRGHSLGTISRGEPCSLTKESIRSESQKLSAGATRITRISAIPKLLQVPTTLRR